MIRAPSGLILVLEHAEILYDYCLLRSVGGGCRLKEIGPRMTLTLTKITDGMCAGEALYHKFDTLTDEQKEEIKQQKAEKKLVVCHIYYRS